MTKKFTRVSRTLTLEQKQENEKVRQKAKEEFSPLDPPRDPSEKGRIALAIRKARRAQGPYVRATGQTGRPSRCRHRARNRVRFGRQNVRCYRNHQGARIAIKIGFAGREAMTSKHEV
jgi:hypothetical protein